MNIIKLILFLLIGMSFQVFGKTPPPTAELNQLLSNLSEFSADFKQTSYNAKHQILQESKGHLMLLRPGNFKWEVTEPTHQILITNGKTLWVYDVDLEQVTQQKLSDQGELNPAQLLSGSIASLEQQFSVTEEANPSYRVFLLKPKAKGAVVKWIRLQFDQHNLVMMQFDNELDETNDFQFSHIQTSLKLSPRYFNFAPPRGVDVLVNQ